MNERVIAPPPVTEDVLAKFEASEAPDTAEPVGAVSGEGADTAAFIGIVGARVVACAMAAVEAPDYCPFEMLKPGAIIGSMGGIQAQPPREGVCTEQELLEWAIDRRWPGGNMPNEPKLTAAERRKEICAFLEAHGRALPKKSHEALDKAIRRAVKKIRARS
jgi:hypothetical protein